MRRGTRWGRGRLVWLAAILPIALVVAAAVYGGAVLPRCALCHSQKTFVEGTQSSAHSAVKCASCHEGTGKLQHVSFAFRHASHEVPLVRTGGRDWAAVADEQCLSCHKTIKRKPVTSNGIRIDHALCTEAARCTDCHSTTAHGRASSWPRVYDMETCLSCHVNKASMACDLCHEGRLPANRVTTGVFAVTHGTDWQKTHGMGNAATCTACHTAAACEKCHGPGLPHGRKFVETHPEVAQDPKAKCFGCHEKTFCEECHGLQMPHPNQFTRGHSKAAEADRKLCNRCHAASDCSTCHEKHVHPGGSIGLITGSGAAGGAK